MVRVEGLTAQAWEMDGRSGMAFRATAIRSSGSRRARRGEGGGVMSAAQVVVCVREDEVLRQRAQVSDTGELSGLAVPRR